jgi:exonuclease VII large subunit
MQIISSEQQRLNEASRAVESYSIDNILKLGFSVLRDSERTISSIEETAVGQQIDILLKDGILGAEIKSINKK